MMMGSYFSLVQWQELELQALIFRHMVAGAAVPPELLHLVKKSLITSTATDSASPHNPTSSSPYYICSPYYAQYHSAMMQTGYWGRAAMDPEPGRCRRTDGKKWRCSRDVVTGQKYCERHMHRGRNRSRKHVEATPTSASASAAAITGALFDNGGDDMKTINSTAEEMAVGTQQFSLSGPPSSSMDLLQLNQRPMKSMIETKCCSFESLNDSSSHGRSGGNQTLRPFFDDWPRSIHDTSDAAAAANMMVSATSLSISMPGNPASDFSLKLGTGGNGDAVHSNNERERMQQMSWSTGGPLAEALRSSSTSGSTASPISVLQQHHRLPRNSVSETSS